MKRFLEFVAEDTAHKGYIIRTNPMTGQVWIEKDGQNISTAKDVADAKSIIDMLSEDEGAGAPANCAGTGNIAGLGIGKAGKPANWGEPGGKRRRVDEADAVTDKAFSKSELMIDGSTRELDAYHPEPDYSSKTDDELDIWLRTKGRPTSKDWKAASQPKTREEASHDDVVMELVQEGLLESEKPSETFAGAPVFEVDMDKLHKSRFGKNRYHRYSRYVGEDEVGEQIRQHGRSRKSGDIILKDSRTSVMTYLRRKSAGK